VTVFSFDSRQFHLLMEYRWKLSVFTKWDDVDDPVFFENWKKWYESVPLNQVFSHPVLIKTWTDCYRKFQNLEPLYCVAQTGDTVFFLPLICWYRNWKNAFLKIVVPAGFSDYNYHDPLVTAAPSPELLRSFWSLIQQKVLAGSQTEYDMVDMDGMHFPGMHMRWEKDEACPLCFNIDVASTVEADYEIFESPESKHSEKELDQTV